MEGLSHDFYIEDNDDEDEEKSEKKEKPKNDSLLEYLSDNIKKQDKDRQIEKNLSPDIKLDNQQNIDQQDQNIDIAPELDAEAPLEHLSRAESEAIAETIATERLVEIQSENQQLISSEVLAAESFLENIEASGDVEQSYQQTLTELGETAIESLPQVEDIQIETALPVDPESLREAARQEIQPSGYYHLKRVDKASTIPEQSRQPAIHHQEEHSTRADEGIVDYLIGRRYNRINKEKSRSYNKVENGLRREVERLRLEISSRENYLRKLSQNKDFKKPNIENRLPKKPSIIEEILTKDPEKIIKSKAEVAGIKAHTMDRADLIKVAEKIPAGETNLKQIFDSHQVGEKGLRRVVAEYLRGGNFKKVLKRELVEHEKDFERDPRLRDQGTSEAVETKKTNLDDLLQRSGITWAEPKTTYLPTNDKQNDLADITANPKPKVRSTPKMADIIMLSAIIIMVAIIAILLINR